jgi:hypothetical protein
MPTPEAVIHEPTVMAARSQARSPVVVDPPATPHSERRPDTLRSTNQADQRFEAALLSIIERDFGLAEIGLRVSIHKAKELPEKASYRVGRLHP